MDGNHTTNSINITRWHLFVCIVFLMAATVYGCQLLGESEIDSPLAYSAQREKIIEIAPHGTSRAEAITKLKAAGIAGEFSRGESTYYCGSWTQKDGTIWRTNVALLFDEEGKVIGTRPIEAAFGFSEATQITKQRPTVKKEKSAPITLPTTENVTPTESSARSGPRRPFDE